MTEIQQVRAEAKELINGGNSKEISEGQGMLNTLERLKKYYFGFKILEEYFDSIPDSEILIVHKKLKRLQL